MKHILHPLKTIAAIALVALAAGCATTQQTEDTLVAAGFKAVTPATPAQTARLQALPPNKVATIRKGGQTYYVFPDAKNNRAYIGGPKQYQSYQQYQLANNIATENLESAEMYQDAAMDWGAWGGWGGWGMGWY